MKLFKPPNLNCRSNNKRWTQIISESAANPNTQRSQNKATDVVNRQYSRRLLEMDILMFETC